MNQLLDTSGIKFSVYDSTNFLTEYINKVKDNNLFTLFNNSSLIVKLITIYIIFTCTKSIITGIISLILYTAVITATIYYVYNSLNKQ
jgi:hypothetical protein